VKDYFFRNGYPCPKGLKTNIKLAGNSAEKFCAAFYCLSELVLELAEARKEVEGAPCSDLFSIP